LEGVSDIFDSAGKSLNSGFDALNKVIKTREDTQASNWEAEKANNTRAAIDMLSRTKTPEELAAMQASGELDRYAAQFGDQFDQAKLREATAAQLNTLRKGQVDSFNHAETLTAQRAKPIMEQFALAGLDGDEATQAKLRAENPDLPWSAAVAADQTLEQSQYEQKLANDLRPYQHANAKGALGLQAQTLEADSKKAKDQKIVDGVITNRLRHQTQVQAQQREGMIGVAKLMGSRGINIPIGNDGMPDISGLSDAQKAAYADELDKVGISKFQTASQMLEETRAELLKHGVSADSIAAAEPLMNDRFRNNGKVAAEDQELVDRQIASIDQKVATAVEGNMFYASPKTMVQDKGNAVALVETMLKDGTMTKTNLRGKISTWMDKGLEIQRDGKTVNVPIPPKVIEYALKAGLEEDVYFFQNNDTDLNMINIIKQVMTDPQYQSLRDEADWLNRDGPTKDKAAIKDFLKGHSNAKSPTEILEEVSAFRGKMPKANGQEKKVQRGVSGSW
jgi:hypothetical protein